MKLASFFLTLEHLKSLVCIVNLQEKDLAKQFPKLVFFSPLRVKPFVLKALISISCSSWANAFKISIISKKNPIYAWTEFCLLFLEVLCAYVLGLNDNREPKIL